MNRLDSQWYYYQNPQTGIVSASPLSIRQLIRLFCPVREGLKPILPSNTQCLPVRMSNNNSSDVLETTDIDEQPEEGQQEHQQQEESCFGEWKAASQIDVLREASCNEWFWTIQAGSTPEGPGSCRKLFDLSTHYPSILVYAKDVIAEWTEITKLPSLQLVFEALQNIIVDSTIATQNTLDMSDANQHETKQQSDQKSQEVQDELEAFLSSTEQSMGQNQDINALRNDDVGKGDNDDDDHAYESDGGTRYIKDPLSGNWIHEALAPPEIHENRNKEKSHSTSQNNTTVTTTNSLINKSSKKKSKKAKFAKRNAKHWIYVSGLPRENITEDDLQHYFTKVGILDLDPETLHPKIKLYKEHATGKLKGDASICYARSESVDLALQILDDSLWDKDHRIKVERAHFEAKQDNIRNEDGGNDTSDSNSRQYHKRKRPISEAQRKVARLAVLQAQDEGFGERLAGGRKGLRIIVIKGMMEGIPENRLEDALHESCQEFGPVEKITCMTKTNIVIVKFVEPIAASAAVEAFNGKINPFTKDKMEAIYWDGVTDYTKSHGEEDKEREEEEKRHEEFGNWLESQEELPPELQLQVAGDE